VLSFQLAWFIAFVGSVIATAEHTDPVFPNYAWFAVAYMLCVIIGVFVVIASDTTQTYHVAVVGYLACGLVLTSSSVNSTIYSSNGAKEATAAGHILLSMVNVSLTLGFLWTRSNRIVRSCGFSTLDRLLQQFPAPTSIHSLLIRITKPRLVEEAWRTAMAMDDQTPRSHRTFHRRCTHQLN
jgi:hypothetical protein